MEDSSIFDDFGASSDFEPVAVSKPKAKPATKPAAKKAATTTKVATSSKAAPKKLAQTTLKMKAPVGKKRSQPDTEDEIGEEEPDSVNDDSLLSNTPPSAKKQKKAPAPKKSSGKPLHDINNEGMDLDGPSDAKSKKATNSSSQYQRLTQLEHVLKRPDTYIGSVERTEKQMWVYNSQQECMEMREVSFVPGLYKIFDEIMVNAADNKQNDKNMDALKVTINREKGEISVFNNGRGIPIEIHEKEKIYIPELIFGHLLTSSNYNDEQHKVTGGRNGFGAKLCNIFSAEFTLETADSRSGKKYKQIWTKNMSNMGKAKITSCKSDDFTKVTFTPDFSKFGMDGIDDDFEALVKRRVYDLAGTVKGVKVSLNGERIKLRNFEQYMKMYTKAIVTENGEEGSSDNNKIITESPDPRWEIGFAVSDGSFQQVSFVNSIATTSGGTHVNYISDQIVNKLMDIMKKKNKNGAALKPNQIRNHIFLFVNCLIVNPAFTGQTKEQLTTKASQFGSKCTVSDEFLKKVAKTEVVNNILHFAEKKADQLLKKSDGSRRSRMSNPKLIDANKAGTREGYKCTLILTEGDSAKGLAVAGRSVVGADEFGVFPLRGKLLNVRDASIDQISKNTEIQNIKTFLGLQHKKEYTDAKSLRYGHLMIMTDQDHDGSHIKGLLINFLQVAYPSLLRIPGFLIEFITPIVKVWKGDPKRPSKSKTFFTMPEYEVWKEEHKGENGWEHKYYKGLGTSTNEDAQIYFQDLDRHLKHFHTMQDKEAELIDLAFSKKKADERKEWLRQFKPGTYLDHSIDKISYTDFVNKELILFSMADNMRSIPSVIDGLKPGQRKVLWSCFKRNLKKDLKVVELAGLVSGLAAYQHGEASLQQTIVGLAQTFAGSNNVNCLEPSGNFGSRLQGGGDCASARYIYTRLSPFARRVFHQLDDPLLTYNTDDEKLIEPQIYCPVVPMILVNGADGIGTGWSSQIPNYNPEDIVENLKLMMDGQPPKTMTPWFRGWTGEITDLGANRYKFSGVIRQTGDNEVEITELPVRIWTQDFKEKLEDIIRAEKIPSFIKDYTDYNTHLKVHFIVQMEDKHMKIALEEGLEEKFKLSRTLATSNLVAFDAEGRITKYATVEDILKEFYYHRIKFYEKRKAHQLAEMQKQLDKLSNQARFVQMIIDGKLVVSKKKKSDLIAELKQKNFKGFPKIKEALKEGELEPMADEESEEDVEADANAYDYLLGMAIWSLTRERVEKLLRQIGDKELEIDELIKLSKEDLWKRDLDEFIAEWRFQLEDEASRQKKVAKAGRRASTKLKLPGKGAGARKRKAQGEDSDSDFGVSKSPKAKKTAAASRAQPKSGMLSYLQKPPSSPKQAKKPAAAALKSSAKSSPDAGVQVDGTSDPITEEDNKVLPVQKKASKVAPKRAVSEAMNENSSDTKQSKTAPARKARAAASKPVKYGGSSDSDSDNGDDLLGDVSKMVKGIGGASNEQSAGSRSLFSASMSRPGSSAGLTRKASRPSARLIADLSDDETDYSKLVPQPSPQKPVTTAAKDTILSDDEDDSFNMLPTAKPLAQPKPLAKPSAKAAKPAAAPRAQKAAPKKAASKQSKPAKKNTSVSDDDDVDAIANNILDSPDRDTAMADSSPPRAARPARRAAAARKPVVYAVDDDSEEESEAFSEAFSDSE
ncbi:MAG: DNA topoisomerase 2 [Sarea resinae]|nr:MAG: DNA topoisomerase 2 [Sarea resinae]